MSAMNSEDIVRERRLALGELVEASAYGEVILRMFLCALIGNRHGAVLVGGMPAGDMIVRSEQLVKIDERFSIAEEVKVLTILSTFKNANADRNRIIHDFGAGSDRGVQFRTYRGSYELVARPASTIQEVKAVAERVTRCWQGLVKVIFDVLGGAEALGPGFEIVREDERGVARRARSVPGRQMTAGADGE